MLLTSSEPPQFPDVGREGLDPPEKTYLLNINLKEGKNLVIRDHCGKTS